MLEEEEIMTVWEDEETGEVHWHKTEYQDLIKKIKDMETKIHTLEQEVYQLKIKAGKCRCGDDG